MSANTVDDELDKLERSCDELLELSRAHQGAVDSGDLDLLNKLLQQRGDLLSDVNLRALGQRAGALRPGAQTGALATRQSLILAKLRDLLRIDEDNRRVLQVRLDEVREQLATMSRGRKVHSASVLSSSGDVLPSLE